MWDGYFTLGGNEVGNSARTIGYTRTAPCPIPWIRDIDCGGIAAATGDDDYFYTNISEAPWYDPDDPDTTSRFLGLYVVDMLGLSDSTRTATITEKITDGAQVSGYRHTARQVRVRALLTARGGDALEYGMTWLRNVLSPDACGVHGGDCGSSDMAFYVDCPPPREDVPDLSPWVLRTNFIPNPRMENSTTGWTAAGGTVQTAQAGGSRLDFAGGIPASSTFFYTLNTAPANPAQPWIGSIEVTVPVGYPTVTLQAGMVAYNNVGGSLPPVITGGSVTIAAGETKRVSSDILGTPLGTAGVRLLLFTASGAPIPAGGRIIVRNAIVENSSILDQPYFDGTTPDVSENGEVIADYSWTGTANNSPSNANTRYWTTRPENDEEYALRTRGLRRVLHTVTCVSGPLIQQEMNSSDNTHFGYLVEFTLVAGVPFVYGATRDIDVPPTTPTVVQDVVYNLVTHPSAELGTGSVLTSTNYSANPSVEVNATGWAHGSAAVTAGDVTSGRSTELAAVGVASFRALFVATNGATGVAASIHVQQEVTLPAAAVAGDRYSINMWAASNIQTGAPVLGTLSIVAFWRMGGSTVRTDSLGTIAGGSGVVTVKSIAPPVGATSVIVRATQAFSTWATGDAIRLYADALAVTKP